MCLHLSHCVYHVYTMYTIINQMKYSQKMEDGLKVLVHCVVWKLSWCFTRGLNYTLFVQRMIRSEALSILSVLWKKKKKRGSIKILEHVFSLRQKLIYCRPHLLSHVTWHRIRVNLPPMATISLSPVQTHDVVLIALSYVLAVLLGTTPHTPLNS